MIELPVLPSGQRSTARAVRAALIATGRGRLPEGSRPTTFPDVDGGRGGEAGVPNAIAEQFGANLRRLRLKSRLAKLAKLHRTEVSLLERGEREPRIGTPLELAGPLEISPLELLEGIHWQWQEGNPAAGAFYIEDRRVK